MGLESATVDALLPRQRKWLFLLPRQDHGSTGQRYRRAQLLRRQKRLFPLPQQQAAAPSPCRTAAAAAGTAVFAAAAAGDGALPPLPTIYPRGTPPSGTPGVHRGWRAPQLTRSCRGSENGCSCCRGSSASAPCSVALPRGCAAPAETAFFTVASPRFRAISAPFPGAGLFSSVDTFSAVPRTRAFFLRGYVLYRFHLSAVPRGRVFFLRGYVLRRFPDPGFFLPWIRSPPFPPFSLSPAHVFT